MKKIKLNLRELQVDSFETIQPNSKLGTVKGFRPPPTEEDFCKTLEEDTCLGSCVSCVDTCANTCAGYTCDPNVGTCCIHC
ncbi:MAG: hypothetical protein ACEPO8_11310 [Rhodothermaceae bacterium]